MSIIADKRCLAVLLSAVVLCVAVPVAAELADVYLKSGLRLRGDVTATDEEVTVRNAAGEVRLPRADVERIVPLEAPATRPATRPTRSAQRTTSAPAEPQQSADKDTELPAAPLLSEEDIQRLKLLELKLDGPAEPVRVRFLRKGRQRDLPLEVLDELQKRSDYRSEWEDVLTRGQPYEKLRLIVRETGTTHADRIVIESDPEVFDLYRRHVLPLVNKSCGRSGCHAGKAARTFRFPIGSTTSETYSYTTFVLLNQMEAEHGPLLDRTDPEASLLLAYLLPREGNRRPHPAAMHGPSFKHVVQKGDRNYTAILDWINDLIVPQPEYRLKYENPYAVRPGQAAPQASTPDSQPADTPESQPTP
jgi:hypothetical protein